MLHGLNLPLKRNLWSLNDFVRLSPVSTSSITDASTGKQLAASSSLKNKRIYLDFRPGYKKPREFESDILLLGGVSVSVLTSKFQIFNLTIEGKANVLS